MASILGNNEESSIVTSVIEDNYNLAKERPFNRKREVEFKAKVDQQDAILKREQRELERQAELLATVPDLHAEGENALVEKVLLSFIYLDIFFWFPPRY